MTWRRSPRRKNLLVDLGLALLLALVAAVAVERKVASDLLEEAEAELLMLEALRTTALLRELESSHSEVALWSDHGALRDGFATLIGAWRQPETGLSSALRGLYVEASPFPEGRRQELGDAGDGSLYSQFHVQIHERARLFLEAHGYYDLFLIDADGDVIYTFFKEEEFGTNVLTGPWRDTGLGEAFREAVAADDPADVAFADFARYEPSAGMPSAFLASAVHDGDGRLIGVLAVQSTSDAVNRILQFTAGMGDTGETYAVGQDLLMRSVPRFSESPQVLETLADTEPVRRALAGESGVMESENYRGERVLVAYGFLGDDQARWAVLAEKDVDEIMRPLGRLRRFLALGVLAALLLAGLLSATGLLERPQPLQTSPLS
jgi:methyl-accepting chemotaxis protein